MKRDIKKLTALMVAGVLMVIPVGASAEKGKNVDNSNKPTVEDKIKVDDTNELQVKDDKTKENVVEDANYISFQGEVTEVADNKITVKENENNSIMFHLSTMIIGTKDGQVMEAKDIKAGDKVMAIYTSHTPMALSYPGQMTPMMIIVQNSDNNVKLDKFNEELVSFDGSLKLVINETTKLEAYKTKQAIAGKDLLNKELLVIYGATTRSIPAQTLADGVIKVMVMPSLEEVKKEQNDLNSKPENKEDKVNKSTAHTKIAISKEAKSMGYKVNWNPKTKIVVLTKGEDVIEIFVGTTKYKINGMEKTSTTPAILEKGATYVSSEILDLLKK